MSNFYIHDPELCYMDGNSLGRLPIAAAERLQQVIHKGWGTDLIRGWNADWIDLPQRIGGKIATIVGADQEQVIVSDSTSINLFKLATAALNRQQGRTQVIVERTNFPTDVYIVESAIEAANNEFELHLVGTEDQVDFPYEELEAALNDQTALVVLSHVAFRSGALADMQRVTELVHQAGGLVLWDLSHSVGVVPIELDEWNVDLAVGCTYKYLCGGPGAPAFLYVNKDLNSELENPIKGWFSHAAPFKFSLDYKPHPGSERFLTGTPPVLSMCAIEEGVNLVLATGVESLRRQSQSLSELFVQLFNERLTKLGYELRSPVPPDERGSHLSFGHPEARRITANLIEKHNVIPDFREPDNIRFGIAPLYNSQRDIERSVDALEASVRDREFESIQIRNEKVT